MSKKYSKRICYQRLGRIYFWTANIHKWKNLLYFPAQKEMIVNSLRFLQERGLVTVYAFTILPNRIHIIWKQHKLNGKEMPRSSFMKHTARELIKLVKHNNRIKNFEVDASNKEFQIWKPNSPAIELYSKKFLKQKLHFIHTKSLLRKNGLNHSQIKDFYSSSNCYESSPDSAVMLNDIFNEIGPV